jgi:signal transduction histidine kinase/ligand-binding sensor domain-containing protein
MFSGGATLRRAVSVVPLPSLGRRLLGVALLLGAFTEGAAGQSYAFRHFGAEAGVPAAFAVAFDGAGALYVGTNDGLARFDGRAFVPVPLPVPGAVWRLAEAPDGSVWGLTNRAGLFRLAPGGLPAAVPTPPALRRRLHEQIWPIRLVLDRRSRPWLSGGDGTVYAWEGPGTEPWRPLLIPDTDFLADFFPRGEGEAEHLVVAGRDRVGVLPLGGGPVTWLPPLEGRVRFVRPHPGALAWVGTERGVYRMDPEGTLHPATLPGEGVWQHTAPGVDPDGRLLVFTDGPFGMRVVRYTPDGAESFAAGPEEGHRGVLALHLAHDPEGGVWIAHAGGLSVLEHEAIRTYPLRRPDGGGEHVNALAGDPARGALWVSTYGGLYRLEGNQLLHASSPGTTLSLYPLVGPDGEADWLISRGSGWEGRSSRSPHPQRGPLLVHDGPAGRLETDRQGLWRVREGRRVKLSEADVSGARGSEDVTGRVWLGAELKRLDVVWGDSLGSTCRSCLPPTLREALRDLNARLSVGRVVADAFGRVWVQGNTGGLGVLWPLPDGTWAGRVLGEEDGLLSHVLSDLALSPDGQRLWLGTFRGVQGLSLRPGTPHVEPFVELRAGDGLPGEMVRGVLEDGDGFLWTSAVPGELHRLDWRALAARRPSPEVRVDGVQVNGLAVAGWERGLSLRAGDRLGAELAARTYRAPQRVRLEYRLAGRDTTWADLGGGRHLTLAALPSGNHALELRAVREGRPPGPVLRLPLSVAPPWWRAPWFLGLSVLGLALGGYGVHAAREGRRREDEALRLRIATDLHDEVGTGLTEISLYSELIRRVAGGPEGDGARRENAEALVSAWAQRVGEQATALSSAMRDVVWAIREDDVGWEALELRMKDAALALLTPRGIELDAAGEREGTPPVSALVRQNLLLFLKEAVHNAVRHAEPSRVTVRWRLARRALSLEIADDGKGFDPATAPRGTGLLSLRRRAQELGGTFTLEAAPGSGTRIRLDVPLAGR